MKENGSCMTGMHAAYAFLPGARYCQSYMGTAEHSTSMSQVRATTSLSWHHISCQYLAK